MTKWRLVNTSNRRRILVFSAFTPTSISYLSFKSKQFPIIILHSRIIFLVRARVGKVIPAHFFMKSVGLDAHMHGYVSPVFLVKVKIEFVYANIGPHTFLYHVTARETFITV